MRTLDMLSDNSLTNTAPTPWNGEPSRRMTHPRKARLEVAGVDRLQARLVDREPQQRAVDRDDRARRVRPHVAFGGHAKAIGGYRLDLGHARNRRQPPRDATSLGLDFDHEAGTEHLHGKLRHRAHQD